MSRRPGVLLVLFALLLAGCGLPLQSGVQVPGQVSPEDYEPAQGQVLPPGPDPEASPREVVRQFVNAQRNGVGRHAIAREFLAPEIREAWDDTAGVQIYDRTKDDVQPPVISPQGVASVRVLRTATASIGPDGSYDPSDTPLVDSYRLRQDPARGWVLTDVPPGLRLEADDLPRSFAPRRIYYLARGPGPSGHLAADLAFLPVTDPAAGLVRRLLAGPSATLQGAVDSAAPPGTELRSVTTDAAGLVTVDLSGPVATLATKDRERLSAQLVWTLRGVGPEFVRLRLLADGRPVDVPGVEAGEPQPRDAWSEYDPEGLPERATAYYLADRRLRAVDGPQPAVTTVAADQRPAELAAVSPRTDQVALLTDVGVDQWQLRTGPLSGELPEQPELVVPALSSPSWGSGRGGLWLLQGADRPRVVVLRDGRLSPVPVEAPPGLGRLVVLRVSRDGARVALVAGDDVALQRAYVGTVDQSGGDLRITKVRPLGSNVTEVADVAWSSGTSLVVLGRVRNLPTRPLELSVDGSGAVDLVPLPGLEQLTPVSLAAAAGQPLLVAAIRPDGAEATALGKRVVLRDEGGVLAELGAGNAPFYPG